jgi:myotubularin-related protein 1/2
MDSNTKKSYSVCSTALILLPGEIESFERKNVEFEISSDPPLEQGTFVITNFRVHFMCARLPYALDIPLQCLHSVQRENTQLELKTKTFFSARFNFSSALELPQIHGILTQYAFLGRQHQNNSFAYRYFKNVAAASSSLKLSMKSQEPQPWYDARREFARLGLGTSSDSFFRIDDSNADFKLCSSYPPLLVVPRCITKDQLSAVAAYRSHKRLPAVVYRHSLTGATISRCAQPLGGVRGLRCAEDEAIVNALRLANPSNTRVLHLLDARPYKAAWANAWMGKGFESTANYSNTSITFLNIDNIHAVRAGLTGLAAALAPAERGLVPDDVAQTSAVAMWLRYAQLILSAAVRIVGALEDDAASVLVHCSDGWDRTSQLTSLAMLLLDPYYRTRRGFSVLVEQEWLSFGHKFAERLGHCCPRFDDDQRSPVFVQWLDCVWQVWAQFPAQFEFTEAFLLALVGPTCIWL